jgi:hypothetical protein
LIRRRAAWVARRRGKFESLKVEEAVAISRRSTLSKPATGGSSGESSKSGARGRSDSARSAFSDFALSDPALSAFGAL